MDKFLPIIQNSTIFNGIDQMVIKKALLYLNPKIQNYKKEEKILSAGNKINNIGIILHGNALIIEDDYWGNRNIISKILPGKSFAGAFALSNSHILNVSIVADSNCIILYLNMNKLINMCLNNHSLYFQIIKNLMVDFAEKNIKLNEKLTHMSRRSIKQKILSYLSFEAIKHNHYEFDINFNRQELADYLSVDRSALSNELCKLRNDGILNFKKNHFILYKKN